MGLKVSTVEQTQASDDSIRLREAEFIIITDAASLNNFANSLADRVSKGSMFALGMVDVGGDGELPERVIKSPRGDGQRIQYCNSTSDYYVMEGDVRRNFTNGEHGNAPYYGKFVFGERNIAPAKVVEGETEENTTEVDDDDDEA